MRCQECERAELLEQRQWLGLLVLWFIERRERRRPYAFLDGMSAAFRAGLGILPSHYDRHLNEWVRTGEPLELRRMLRQVR